MAAKKMKRSPRKIKNLSARKASAKDIRGIRGGYIGETEKLSIKFSPEYTRYKK